MNRLDRLVIQVRDLSHRLAQLESARAAAVRPARTSRRKSRYVDIAPEVHLARLAVWARYQQLKRAETVGKKFNRKRGECAPWTVEWFCGHVTDGEGLRFVAREFWRWLSDANTHPAGGTQDCRIIAAVQAEVAAMIASGVIRIPRDR